MLSSRVRHELQFDGCLFVLKSVRQRCCVWNLFKALVLISQYSFCYKSFCD